MKIYDSDGNRIYFYRFKSYEEEFWMQSKNQYSENTLLSIIKPLKEEYEKDILEEREKISLLYARLKNGQISEKECEDGVDEITCIYKKYGLIDMLKEKYDMQEVEPRQTVSVECSIWN